MILAMIVRKHRILLDVRLLLVECQLTEATADLVHNKWFTADQLRALHTVSPHMFVAFLTLDHVISATI